MKIALLTIAALLAACGSQGHQSQTISLTNEVVTVPRERASQFTCVTGSLVCNSEYGPNTSSRNGRLECRCLN